ncbi:MAG: hypothetical protein EOP64_00225 [Sphingomonas sp.]|nr:MAG: hypothetical protein EOP64_00225 [Sphingomonas sp.]
MDDLLRAALGMTTGARPAPAKPDPIALAALSRPEVPQSGLVDVVGEAVSSLRSRVAKSAATSPIVGVEPEQRVVHCVVCEPDTADTDGEAASALEIRQAAHNYIEHSRIIKSMHKDHIRAVPVESYIAPSDLHFEGGPSGPQTVQKGAWVVAIRVRDDAEWQKVKDGTYRGISMGGYAYRRDP